MWQFDVWRKLPELLVRSVKTWAYCAWSPEFFILFYSLFFKFILSQNSKSENPSLWLPHPGELIDYLKPITW